MKKWKLLHRIVKLKSNWVTVYADKLLDDKDQVLEYWHYERPDSVIVIAIQEGKFLLPAPQYRVGVDKVMTDFAGSRIDKDIKPEQAAINVIGKELGFAKQDITEIKTITKIPLAVDSSFSTQKLHGFIAKIKKSALPNENVQSYKQSEVTKLRSAIHCAQCKLILDEYILSANVIM